MDIFSETTSFPFLLRPSFKDYIWGGERLRTVFGKKTEISPLAESWECSTHPDGPSYAASGAFDGQTLAEILNDHPEFLGSRALALTGGKPELPILVKLIDAKRDLSVQVHPDDAYALSKEGQPGKTEMWYVLDAEPGSSLVCGLAEKAGKEEFKKAALDGSVMQILRKVPVKKGDVFFISPGTVHAIGAGVLVAEIQQSSNLTYRLYDYGRLGADGKPRQLHLDKAMDVADLTPHPVDTRMSCKYFTVKELDLAGHGSWILMKADAQSFHALLCTEGRAEISVPGGRDAAKLAVSKGDCVFVPACGDDLELKGSAFLLDICC